MEVFDSNEIKFRIEACAIHHEHPEVEVVGDKFNIKTCCTEFSEQSLTYLQELLAEQAKQAILNAFKGL